MPWDVAARAVDRNLVLRSDIQRFEEHEARRRRSNTSLRRVPLPPCRLQRLSPSLQTDNRTDRSTTSCFLATFPPAFFPYSYSRFITSHRHYSPLSIVTAGPPVITSVAPSCTSSGRRRIIVTKSGNWLTERINAARRRYSAPRGEDKAEQYPVTFIVFYLTVTLPGSAESALRVKKIQVSLLGFVRGET